jgi:hypothetical protein
MELFFSAAWTAAPNDLINTIGLRTRRYSPARCRGRFTDSLGQHHRRGHIIPFTTAAISYSRGLSASGPVKGGASDPDTFALNDRRAAS